MSYEHTQSTWPTTYINLNRTVYLNHLPYERQIPIKQTVFTSSHMSSDDTRHVKPTSMDLVLLLFARSMFMFSSFWTSPELIFYLLTLLARGAFVSQKDKHTGSKSLLQKNQWSDNESTILVRFLKYSSWTQS